MDAEDEFQDAVDSPQQYQEQPDGSVKYTDKDGFEVHLPKVWDFDNSLTFDDEGLKEIIMNVHPGDCAVTEQIRNEKPKEPFIAFGKAKPFRILFYPPSEPGPWSINDEEKEYLAVFKQFCKDKGEPVPECDGEILRWAYAYKMDSQQVYDQIMIKKSLLMERFAFPVTKRAFELIDKGFMYICGRDRLFRPIIIMKYNVIQCSETYPEPEDVIGAAIITILFMQKYMLKNGVVENYLQVGDSEGLNIFTTPFKLVQSILQFMTCINRGRSRCVIEVNSPTTMSVLWNAVSYFMDENTQQKVSFTSASTNPMLLQMCHPSQLEEKYGGTAPNRKEGEYWPPRLNSNEFGFGEETDMSNVKELTDDQVLKMSMQNNDGLSAQEIEQKFEAMKLEELQKMKQQEANS